MEVAKEVKNRLSCAACTCSSLNNSNFIFSAFITVNSLMRSFEVTSYSHSIVRFKNLTRG